MADLMEKFFGGILAITVAVYLIANAFLPALSGANLVNVGGNDLSWVSGVLGIIVIVGLGYASYRHFLGGK